VAVENEQTEECGHCQFPDDAGVHWEWPGLLKDELTETMNTALKVRNEEKEHRETFASSRNGMLAVAPHQPSTIGESSTQRSKSQHARFRKAPTKEELQCLSEMRNTASFQGDLRELVRLASLEIGRAVDVFMLENGAGVFLGNVVLDQPQGLGVLIYSDDDKDARME
jgi:hypothetical protein